MKFSCDRCGKKYATAETPAPGRVYRVKCKACGHIIVVKASTGVQPTAATEMRAPTSTAIPAVQAPAPHRPAGLPDIQLETGGAPAQQTSSAISAAPAREELRPPADAGYVDLFAEAPREESPRREDPFLAATRASLPESYGSAPARGAFAGLPGSSSHPAARPQPGHLPTTTPKIPDIPKPTQRKSVVPIALIGAGAVVLVGILALVLLNGKSWPGRTAQAAAPAAAQPAAPAPVPPAQPPAASPVAQSPDASAPQPRGASPAPPPPAALPAPQPPAAAAPAAPAAPEKREKRASDKRASE